MHKIVIQFENMAFLKLASLSVIPMLILVLSSVTHGVGFTPLGLMRQGAISNYLVIFKIHPLLVKFP